MHWTWCNLMLAVPRGHPLTKLKSVRLRDLNDAAFIWFPRRESPAYYDRLMHECFRGGLKSPRIVQEAVNEATILSLVSCRLGVAFVSNDASHVHSTLSKVVNFIDHLYIAEIIDYHIEVW